MKVPLPVVWSFESPVLDVPPCIYMPDVVTLHRPLSKSQKELVVDDSVE